MNIFCLPFFKFLGQQSMPEMMEKRKGEQKQQQQLKVLIFCA
jgi:hypothetical protein